MEIILIYLLKVSGVLAIFYLAYRLFLRKETFFAINRHFFIVGILVAILMPLISINNYIEITPISYNSTSVITSNQLVTTGASQIEWTYILFIIYITGVAILAVKFTFQIIALSKLVKNHTIKRDNEFRYVEVDKEIAPFSFFNYICYNPHLYSASDLSAIIKHEEAHSRQWHSIDVILSHVLTIFTWMNPFSWLYQKNVKQNLEFLADESATKQVVSIKKYQYTLLKVSGNQFCPLLVNNFYSSLIKNRIVMLNKSKSNKKNIFKIVLILPVLAIFLVSFNTKNVYIPAITEMESVSLSDDPISPDDSSELIEITIDKNTSNKELKKIKKDLAKDDIDFSYTVAHNSKNEITNISIHFMVKKANGNKTTSSSSFNNGDDAIDPIHILYDQESNSISMGNNRSIHVDIHEDTENSISIHTGDHNDEHGTVEIIDVNGKETIKINGKVVSRDEYEVIKEKEGLHEKHISIKKSKNGSESNIYIQTDSDSDSDIDIITGGNEKGMFFINTDGKEQPVFIIDGKQVKKKDIESLDPESIESINIYKDEKNQKRYGKNGTVKITTKKANN